MYFISILGESTAEINDLKVAEENLKDVIMKMKVAKARELKTGAM